MATSDCGCGSSDCNDCSTTEKKYFIAEVEESNANTCQGDKDSCAFHTPFYDQTLANSGFNISAVGDSFIVQVCDVDRWAVGQWVYIPNAGRFQIISKDGCNNLFLRNGCSSGDSAEAIPNNASPGKHFSGVQNLWLVSDPGCGGDPNSDFCNNVLDAIAECDQQLCKYFPPVGEEDNYYRLLAGTHEGDEEGLLSCVRKAFDILVTPITLCFPRMANNSVSSNDDGSVQDVQRMPSSGCLVRRALPARNAIDVYCGGAKQYLEVPSDWSSKEYALGIDADGCPTFKELDVGCDLGQTRHPITTDLTLNTGAKTINTTNRDQEIDFSSIMPTIPDCAGEVAVEVVVRLSVAATLSNQFPSVSCKVNQDGIDVLVAVQHSQPSFHTDTNSVILKLDKNDPKLTFVCAREGATSGGTFSLLVYSLAFHY